MAIVKIPFCSRVMGFSNNRPLFLFSWEREFSTGNCGTEEPSRALTLHHEQTISGEEMHTLITFMVSVMASHMHIRHCAVLLYSKDSSSCYLLTVRWYTVACKPNLYVYALMMESK